MTRPATSVIRYARFFRLSRANKVLDYGAGTLRNALYLADRGFKVYAADVPEQARILRSRPGSERLAGILDVGELMTTRLNVDVVLCTYVFNIIVPKAQRKLYLDNVTANLRPGGFLLIEINSRLEEMGCDSPLQHYHCFDHKAKSYTHDELDRLLGQYRFQRICHYYSDHALAAVYQLASSDVKRKGSRRTF